MSSIVHHLFSTNEKHLNEIEENILLGTSELLRNIHAEDIEIEDILNKTKVSPATFDKIFSSTDSVFKKLALRLTNEMVLNFLSHIPETKNAVTLVALKSKIALLVLVKSSIQKYSAKPHERLILG